MQNRDFYRHARMGVEGRLNAWRSVELKRDFYRIARLGAEGLLKASPRVELKQPFRAQAGLVAANQIRQSDSGEGREIHSMPGPRGLSGG